MLVLLFSLVGTLINLVLLVLVVQAVLSWLISFEVVDRNNRAILSVYSFTQRVTEPMLRPIRPLVGPVGGLDLSPMILGLGLVFGFEILQWVVLDVAIGHGG
jgi:YggT family protein